MRTWPTIFICAVGLASCTPTTRSARAPAPPQRAARRIPLAITIDDLPFSGPTPPGGDRDLAIDRIVAAAREHGAPISGFVTCSNMMEDASDLRRWAAAGVALENHSHSHRALDDLGIEAWREDIARCQERIEAVTGRAPSFFRYPFLRTGSDRALRDEGFRVLDELSLTRAPVSIDTSEWVLVRPYVAALRAGDRERAAQIAEAYVAHIRAAARRFVDRADGGAAQILLLHANALASDHLGRLLDVLEEEGFTFVSLDEAMRDPLYARTDCYAGRIGLSWLYRVECGAERAWAWDAAQMHALAVRFGGASERESFDLDEELRIRRVAERTWIITHEEPWAANSLLAEMPDGTLLFVDTPYTDDATRSLLAWAQARFGPRPLVAINTHFHPDRVGGNGALDAAGASIIASEQTARLVEERTASMRESLASWLADRPAIAARFAHYDPLPATRLFDQTEGATLRFGEEEVRIVFPGAAHSSDNVVVHFPARALLFGGCMVMAGDRVGNTSDADLASWPRAIERLREFRAAIVVPGHGDRTDPGLLDHTLELLHAR